MDNTLFYLAAFITLIAVAVSASIIVVRRNGRGADELIKQLIVWVAIASLLPLTCVAGASLFHPRAKLKDLMAQQTRVNQETYDTENADNRNRARDRGEAIRKEIEQEQSAVYRAMFWVGAPIGFVALLVGLYVPVVSVGSGLAFGGLCTLSTGCYSYWDDMSDGLRFGSLLIVLATVVAVGLTKFRRSAAGAAGEATFAVPTPRSRPGV